MKKLLFAMTLMAISSVVSAQFVIDTRTAAGAAQSTSLFVSSGTNLGNTTAKSTAPGAGVAASGALFSSVTFLDAHGTFIISGHPSFVAGQSYKIEITTNNGATTNAPTSAYVVSDTGNANIATGTIALTAANTGNVWTQVVASVLLGAGAQIRVAEAAGQVDRFNMDAIRVTSLASVSDWSVY